MRTVGRLLLRRRLFGALTLPLFLPDRHAARADDRCLQEVAVTGAYESPCMRDRTREFDFGYAVGRVQIQQGDVGPGTTGAAVWIAGTALASYLAANPGRTVSDQTVVELGCGTGLVGIVAARCGAREVILTDGNPDLLERASGNAAVNLPSAGSRVRVRPLKWGEQIESDMRGTVDVILASDVLYQSSAWRPLASCVAELLRPKIGRLLLAEAGHENTPAQSSLAGFRAVAEGCGLIIGEPEALAYGNTLLIEANTIS